jgi:hypothetical protein
VAGSNTSTSHSETDYTYNAFGRMTGATGFSRNESVTTHADGTSSGVLSVTNNDYDIIWGQAYVRRSVTESFAAEAGGGGLKKIEDTGAHGYNHTLTTTDYFYNDMAQMTGAKGTIGGERGVPLGISRAVAVWPEACAGAGQKPAIKGGL